MIFKNVEGAYFILHLQVTRLPRIKKSVFMLWGVGIMTCLDISDRLVVKKRISPQVAPLSGEIF